MAKASRSRSASKADQPEELKQSKSSHPDEIIEYDPSAPPTVQSQALPELEETQGTIQIPKRFFDARDEMLERLSAPRALAVAQEALEPGNRQSKVLGVGIGFKMVGGILTGEPAVQVLVETKLPEGAVDDALIVPSSLGDDIQTDVREIGSIFPLGFSSKYKRPVPCGSSVGHANGATGTIGCLVVRQNNHLCILSNNHVLVNLNRCKVGDLIIQPGRADGGQAPADVIATLEDCVPLNPGGINLVDAAVAFTSFNLASPNHVTYPVNPKPVAPALGLSVMKNGRSTGSTIGMITGIGHQIGPVDYSRSGGGPCTFRDQIIISGIGAPFSLEGDSGSLIVTVNTKQPVALLFAGSSDNSTTFANPIGAVMDALRIKEIVGGA